MLKGMVNSVVRVGFCVIAIACCAQDGMRRLGGSPNTPAVACMERLFGKRVLWTMIPPLNTVLKSDCPKSRAELLPLLKSNTISVIEEEKYVFLLPADTMPPWPNDYPEGLKVYWKHFQVAVSARLGAAEQNQARLSPEQLERLKDQVLAQARLFQLGPVYTEKADETAVVPVNLDVYVRQMRPAGPRSVVVVLRQEDDDVEGRVLYGEETTSGGVNLSWESPVILARYMTLDFNDVDGDGVEEIVINSVFPGGMQSRNAMTIFDVAGKELTRTLPCEVPGLSGYTATDGVCPIVGETVEFDDSTIPWRIAVSGLVSTGRDAVFTYRNGAYTRVVAPRSRHR